MNPPFEYTLELFNREFTGLMLEEQLGFGQNREVWKLRGLPYVAKIANGDPSQNWREWSFWDDAKGTEMEKWLAPCLCFSSSGRILIQALTKPLINRLYPEKIPDLLTDLKVQNWGVYEDRVVCHDYGTNYVHANAIAAMELKEAEWWDENSSTYLKTGEAVTL